MNRKERRALEKSKGKQPKTIAPIAPISIEMMKLKHPEVAYALTKFEEKCKLDVSNELFNLIFSCVLVALHDKFDFNADQLNTLVSEGIKKLDCVSSGFVTKHDMIGLIKEIGVKVDGLDIDKITHNAQQTHDRLKIYFEEVEAMNKKNKAFELFEQGVLDTSQIAKRIGVSLKTVHNYKWMWKQSKLEEMDIDSFTDKVFGGSDKTEKIEPQEEIKEEVNNLQVEEEKTVANENTTKEEGLTNMGLRKIVKVVSIEGRFATYEPVDQSWDVTIDGQVITLSREQMKVLAEEFKQVAVEEV